MRPILFEGANQRYGQPEGWDEGKLGPCGELSVQRIWYPDIQAYTVTSMWKPTKEELALLNAGGSVAITTLTPHPVPMKVETAMVHEYEDLGAVMNITKEMAEQSRALREDQDPRKKRNQ